MWLKNNVYFQLSTAAFLAVAVYALGLSGGFYFDDEWNILKNQALQLDSLKLDELWNAALSGTAGPLGRPLVMLSFALNHVFFGLDPFYFKLVNLIVHLLCGWTMYALVIALCEYLPQVPVDRKRLLAFLVLLLWLLHPLNLTTVLYAVQRMAGLSALFCLLGMYAYVKARQVSVSSWGRRLCWYVCCFVLFWPLALASKENAALFPAYLFLIELVFLKFRSANRQTVSRPLVISYGFLFLLPSVLLVIYFAFSPDWILNGYAKRDFTLTERLLTQFRVLLFYIGQLVFPLNTSLGLFHDDFVVSKSIFSPWTTAVSILAVVAATSWAFVRIRRYSVVAFGILFFLAAHSLESTILGLELVHEHRNYLASFSFFFAIAYYLVIGGERYANLRAIMAISLVVFFSATTLARATVWGEPAIHTYSEVVNHPQSPRANYGMGKQYAVYASSLESSDQKAEALDQAAFYFERSAELRESYTDGLFGLFIMEGVEGYEMSEEAYQALLDRLANEPFSNNNYNYLNSIMSCLEAGRCNIHDMRLAELINACLENPEFDGGHRAHILERYREYVK
ncbi:hypothetical protein EHN06_13935 [Marinobacter sp. NP-4(2019)]|uniref:hypothetical protein n=1 Tax=Marinobacter sp. NP-4(2019) TaxID=2488665 RepID=UPI000FC3D6B3|nr:hypothetical protein [Marinobacter sp. NP-4(2019)]AZT84554.1 hypothetical protein EHN06_13935 [Marinobacter sp. NP-4(2019)]